MINIISQSYCRHTTSGPKKVVDNLIKGLRLLDYPYVVNKRLDACRRLWIHDDVAALTHIRELPPEIKVVIGPNLVVRPRDFPPGLDLSRVVDLHPSQWSADFWLDFGFRDCPLVPWPCGIDTEEYQPSGEAAAYILVYFKQRLPEELAKVKADLQSLGLAYKVLPYGHYREAAYKRLLSRAKFVVWLGRHESQGIALQEALACNVPVLVCDVNYVGQWLASPREMRLFNREESLYTNTTSAPYFDGRCGLKIKDLKLLPAALEEMQSKLSAFQPRKYIEENLSLQGQALAFLQVYEKYFSLSMADGKTEHLLKSGDWANNAWSARLKFLLKDLYKLIF